MLIDVSYFTTGPRQVMNASVSATPTQNSLSVNRHIMGYVKHYQLAFLCEMLGDALAVKIDSYLAVKEENEKASNDDNGFVVNEQYEIICSELCESFADYVFFYILRDAATQATDRGLVVWKNENEVVSPVRRQVTIWNEMVKRNIRFKALAASSRWPVEVSENMLTSINPYNL